MRNGNANCGMSAHVAESLQEFEGGPNKPGEWLHELEEPLPKFKDAYTCSPLFVWTIKYVNKKGTKWRINIIVVTGRRFFILNLV